MNEGIVLVARIPLEETFESCLIGKGCLEDHPFGKQGRQRWPLAGDDLQHPTNPGHECRGLSAWEQRWRKKDKH